MTQRIVALLVPAIAFSLPLAGPAIANPAATPDRFELLCGRSQLFASNSPLERVAISDPKVASVRVISSRQVMVQGLTAGNTTMTIWTSDGQARAYDVRVALDVAGIQQQLRSHTGNQTLKVSHNGTAFLLSGSAASAPERELAEKLVQAYGQPVVNLVQLPVRQDQIEIEVQVVELSRMAMMNLGLTLGGAQVVGVQDGVRQYVFKPGDLLTGERTAGNISSFSQFDSLSVKFDALQRRGLAKLLARPTLVTTDGGTAKFLAGGEIPIPVQQALGTTTVVWKEFGVRLEVKPTLTAGGRIAMAVAPEVSSLDYNNGLKLASFTIPAIKSRRAETQVVLGAQETLMLGGLLSNEQSRAWSGFPGIADLPIIGELFRSRDWQDNRTELAIFVTPRMIASSTTVPMPSGALQDTAQELGKQEEKR